MKKNSFILLMIGLICCSKPPAKTTPSMSNNFDTQITEKYWKLTGIPGYSLQTGFEREPHMVLRSNANTFKGNGGCNAISGNYEIGKDNEIAFSKIISTFAACPALETEQVFLKILESANQFSLNKDTLILMRDKQSLAWFEAVYLK